MTKQLFLMLGYPGTGKSTFARQLADRTGAIRLSQDYLRKISFQNPREHMSFEDHQILLVAMNKSAEENLRNGKSVIYDANVELFHDRQVIYKLASKFKANSYLLWIKTPVDISIKRNGPAKTDEQFITKYSQMVAEYEKRLEVPTPSEPTILIDGIVNFEHQYAQLLDSL